MKRRIPHKMNHGFTLVELLTSIAIFSIVVFISMSSIIGIFDANRKSRSLKTVMTNLNLALEGMSKELRYGYTYHCGSTTPFTTAVNCPAGEDYISFMGSDGVQTYYRLNAGAIEKKRDSDGFVPITAPEVVIERLTFYVLGAGTNNSLQPKVNIVVQGRAGESKQQSSFSLQTLVSQRKIDHP